MLSIIETVVQPPQQQQGQQPQSQFVPPPADSQQAQEQQTNTNNLIPKAALAGAALGGTFWALNNGLNGNMTGIFGDHSEGTGGAVGDSPVSTTNQTPAPTSSPSQQTTNPQPQQTLTNNMPQQQQNSTPQPHQSTPIEQPKPLVQSAVPMQGPPSQQHQNMGQPLGGAGNRIPTYMAHRPQPGIMLHNLTPFDRIHPSYRGIPWIYRGRG